MRDEFVTFPEAVPTRDGDTVSVRVHRVTHVESRQGGKRAAIFFDGGHPVLVEMEPLRVRRHLLEAGW